MYRALSKTTSLLSCYDSSHTLLTLNLREEFKHMCQPKRVFGAFCSTFRGGHIYVVVGCSIGHHVRMHSARVDCFLCNQARDLR